MKTQLARFVRLFLIAVVPALCVLFAGGTKLTVAAVVAVVVPVLEVAWRQAFPAEPTSSSTSSSKAA